MPYLKVKPVAPLDQFVESIDVQEVWKAEDQVKPTKILPNASIDLIFYYGDRFLHQESKAEVLSPDAFVFGQRNGSFNVRAKGTTGIVVVRFFPWGLSAFTKYDANAFTDKCIHLDEIFPGREGTRCLELIHQADSPEQKILVVQMFLIERMKGQTQPDPLAHSVCSLINTRRGKVSIKEVASLHSMSKRQLDRRFLRAVGITPKKFATINRFQKSLLFKSSGLRVIEVASIAGYFDQAHMTKEFRQLADCTPATLFESGPATPLMTRYNHEKASHFYNTRYLQ